MDFHIQFRNSINWNRLQNNLKILQHDDKEAMVYHSLKTFIPSTP